jgi:acyl-CoA thioester hydrolase
MIQGEVQVRVRYAETDKMGYVYYGNYPMYYEVGRTELIRQTLGLTYKQLEDSGILMPVVRLESTYKKPAFYDDLLTVRTLIRKKPGIKIQFEYEIYNQHGELVNEGNTTLIFVNAQTMKPVQPPDMFRNLLEKYF